MDGEDIVPQSPVFRASYRIGIQKVRPLSQVAATAIIVRSIRKAGLYRNKTGNRYEVQADHGFRKRFGTILKLRNDISYSVSERFLGHKQNTDPSYFRGTRDDMFREFQKVIIDLTIDDTERLRIQSKLKDEKINSLESEKDKKISELEQITKELSARLQKQESMTAEMNKISFKIKQTAIQESDPINPNYPDGGPFDTRLVNLELRKVKEKSIEIFDSEFEESAEVVIRNNNVYCTLDKSSSCKHVLFAIGNPEFYQLVKKYDIDISFGN